jgi:hypothetical protein
MTLQVAPVSPYEYFILHDLPNISLVAVYLSDEVIPSGLERAHTILMIPSLIFGLCSPCNEDLNLP